LLGRTLILAAHPDDEAAGCGALLQRIREPMVVFATDGAPRDDGFWRHYGSRLRYARRRQEEAYAALAHAGVSEIVFLADGAGAQDSFIDQELHRSIPEAVLVLTEMIYRLRPQALLTLAYDGGHPDHDVCSFIGAVLARAHRLPIWEFPLYHRPPGRGIVFQRFAEPGEGEAELEITLQEVAVKRQMLADYSSQHPFLLQFNPIAERLRFQPRYDYSQPPHPGLLNYEAWQWPVTGREVCAAFQRFMQMARRQAG